MSRGATCKVALLVAAIFAGCNRDTATLTSPVVPTAVAERADDFVPPNPPVIFLHYDYMVTPEGYRPVGDTTEHYAPDPAAMDAVVEAFRRHGITLVIDPQHTAIPPSGDISMGPFGCPVNHRCVDFFDLKAQYFRPKGRQPWHYAIFAPFGYLGGQRVSGAAEVGGYNILVTVFPAHRQCISARGVDMCALRQAGTFMHELGHNLGLQHGGDENENYKPNYVSVMNYLYQVGILYTDPGDTHQFSPWWVNPTAEDGAHIVGRRLDYSSGTLPELDELHIDERVGLGGPAGNTDITWYQGGFAWTETCADNTQYNYIRVAAGPLDWNQNGIIEPDVALDVNWVWTSNFNNAWWVCPQFNAGSDGHPLRDYDDWAHIQRFLRTPAYLAGTLRPTRIVVDPPETVNR